MKNLASSQEVICEQCVRPSHLKREVFAEVEGAGKDTGAALGCIARSERFFRSLNCV